jgi:hypothetical protein
MKLYPYTIFFTAGDRNYSFNIGISYPHNYHDKWIVRTAVMSEIGRFKIANGITGKTVEGSVNWQCKQN